MKLLLLTIVVCFTAVLAAPADKKKRDILPGDPRYGTENHHEEHHQEHENEVQISKAAGGYVGSYTVPDDTEDSLQVQPQSSYGPPNYTPSKPLGNDLFGLSDTDKTPISLLVPSTSYGIPDTTQLLNNNYIGPVIDDKKPAIIKTTIQEQPKLDAVQVKSVVPEVHHELHVQPAVVHKQVENIQQAVSLPQLKTTSETQGAIHHSIPSLTSSINSFPSYSYSSYSNIPVKTVDHQIHVKVPQPYHVPVTKHVAVPVPVPHTVEVPKPYYVRVPQPVQVPVNRPYPVEVPRPVPYPVPHYIKTSVPVAQPHLISHAVAQPHVISHAVAQPHVISHAVAQPHLISHTVAQPHVVPHTVISKDSPLQTFFENTQSTFQNVLPSFPTFSNPLEGFNPFQNVDLSSFPSISSFIPSLPSSISSVIPSQIQSTIPATPDQVNLLSNSDSITIDNPALKSETTVTKPIVQPIVSKTHKQVSNKPSTPCAGCLVSSTNKQEYVQPTDANGGYVY